MSMLLAVALIAGLQTKPPFEGAWARDLSGEQIYAFSGGQFQLIVRMGMKPGLPKTYWGIYLEKGTYKLGKRPFPIGGGKFQDFYFLDSKRTDIQPPGVEQGFALNQPKRDIRIEFINNKNLKIDLFNWIRIDPKSVPRTLEEAKTMQIKPL